MSSVIGLGFELMLGDCLDLMKDIPDESIDMILCDLPYGTTVCKWDSILDLKKLWGQYNRVLKRNGVCALFCAQPFTSVLVSSNLNSFKYEWCWKKPKGTGHLNAKKQPMRDKEDIAIFYREQPNYFPQMEKGEPYAAKPGRSKANHRGEDCYGVYKDVRDDNEGFRYPKQVIEFPIVERNKLHPTQKPVALLEYLIKTYTLEGETVLDNCMGSGSTGVACIGTGRRFIGMELERSYFDIACARIKDAAQGPRDLPVEAP